MEEKTALNYDRKSEVKEFDDSKAGVQGLIENGVTKVPQMFYCEQSNSINDGSVKIVSMMVQSMNQTQRLVFL
jgi:hypothetical protein